MLSRTRALTLKGKKKKERAEKSVAAVAHWWCENVPKENSRPEDLSLLRRSIKPVHVCPDTTSASFHHRKQILSAQLFASIFFFFTSATVYLLGSPLPLFLQGPDIIIAVRWMIICLLWKLADCLSPVPAELPPPRGFSRKVPQKWLRRPLGRTKGQIERRAGEEDAARRRREGGREGEEMAMP